MAKYDFDELMSVGVDIGKDVFHWDKTINVTVPVKDVFANINTN